MPISDKDIVYYIAVAAFIMPIILGTIMVFIISRFQRRKYELLKAKADAALRETEVIIEKQNELQAERNRIASDMHDDLGTGLTTINYLVQKLIELPSSDEEGINITNQIKEKTKLLVENMSEIIWAMNSRFDDTQSLVDYIRRMVSDTCEDMDFPYKFTSSNLDSKQIVSGEKRRNILLITKETLLNSIKYSQAKQIDIDFTVNHSLQITFVERGAIGFNLDEKMQLGNGLYNLKKRLDVLHGKAEYKRIDSAMCITFTIPL